MTKHKARHLTRLAAAIAMAVGTADAATAATITVTDGGDSGTASTCTFRQAIQTANSGTTVAKCAVGGAQNTIVFAPSLVNSTITLSPSAGGELVVQAPATSLTITGSGQTIDAGGLSRVLVVFNTSLVASNLTLTGGKLTPTTNVPQPVGGGLYVANNPKGSQITSLSNVNISSSYAFQGGGIGVADGTLTMSNCDVSKNTAHTVAGVLIFGSTATILDSVISGNKASYQTGGAGAFSSSSVSFMHSTISGNYAPNFGGVVADGSTMTLVDSTVSGNSADLTSGNGAAGITAVSATQAGASPATLTMVNTTVYGNSSHASSGLFVYDSSAKLINSTVAANYIQAAAADNVIVQSNSTGTASMTLYNSILAKNKKGTGYSDCTSIGTNTTVTSNHSLADAAAGCSSIVNGINGNIVGVDPLFGKLGNNGGTTQTVALASTSPAIGTGSLALASFNSVPLNYDQRGFGFPRTVAGSIDMGAYQTQPERIFVDGFEAEP